MSKSAGANTEGAVDSNKGTSKNQLINRVLELQASIQ